jgi:hypothetical protein
MNKKATKSTKAALKFAGIGEMKTNTDSEVSMRPIEMANGKKGFIVRVPAPTKEESWRTKEVFARTEAEAVKLLKGKK